VHRGSGGAAARHCRLSTTYDSLYVVPARALEADLWTDDQAAAFCSGRPGAMVRSIRAFPLP